MKTIAKLLVLMMLMMGIWGCGDTGGKEEDTDDDSTSLDTPAFTYSDNEDLATPFYCSGGTVTFEIIHTGTCAYKFDLINKATQTVLVNLATSSGDLNTKIAVSLSKGDYLLSADTACTWKINVYGNCQQYEATTDDSSSSSESSSDNTSDSCNCTGCCSGHGGVICANGITVCADGTALSAACKDKGCIAKGCAGCY